MASFSSLLARPPKDGEGKGCPEIGITPKIYRGHHPNAPGSCSPQLCPVLMAFMQVLCLLGVSTVYTDITNISKTQNFYPRTS